MLRLANVLFGAALLLGSASAHAQAIVETFDSSTVALAGILKPGTDGAWQLDLKNGTAQLENTDEPNAIKFYHIDRAGEATLENAAEAVDVGGDFVGKNAGAGILYRYDSATKSYLAFVVGAKRWTLYQRGPEGVRPRLSGLLPPSKAASRRLRIEPDSEKLTLEIDGTSVGKVLVANMPGTALGIVAISTGRFVFDNLAIIPAGS